MKNLPLASHEPSSGACMETKVSYESIARSISHELRNKLTSIDISVFQLKECFEEESSSVKTQFLLSMIERSSIQINEVLRSFYDAVVHQPLKFEQVLVSALIESAVQKTSGYAQSKGVVINQKPANTKLTVEGEPVKLGDSLAQLLLNAIDACGEHAGTVVIGYSKKGHNKCQIYVSDNGGGINPYILNQIFLPFFTTKTDAMGLGLTYADNIIAQHAGTFSVELRSSTGTTMLIELPCKIIYKSSFS